MGQVPAVVEAHREHGVAGLEERLVHREVGARARVGLDVGVRRAEQGLRPLPGQVLDLVDDPVPAVVAGPRVALRVLVGEDRSGGGEHRR